MYRYIYRDVVRRIFLFWLFSDWTLWLLQPLFWFFDEGGRYVLLHLSFPEQYQRFQQWWILEYAIRQYRPGFFILRLSRHIVIIIPLKLTVWEYLPCSLTSRPPTLEEIITIMNFLFDDYYRQSINRSRNLHHVALFSNHTAVVRSIIILEFFPLCTPLFWGYVPWRVR